MPHHPPAQETRSYGIFPPSMGGIAQLIQQPKPWSAFYLFIHKSHSPHSSVRKARPDAPLYLKHWRATHGHPSSGR